MKLAILSGKGGTGKTFLSVNLAAVAEQATYIDCDVEEPNGRLFLKPKVCRETEAVTFLPTFDVETCNGCRKCVDFCRFHALVFVKKKPIVFPELCHACGGCAMVCPQGSVSEIERPIGIVQHGRHKAVDVVTGILNPGEASGVPVIRAVLQAGQALNDLTVVDCPPGSSCAVMESVMDADCCILVAEPTAFGFHNFQMVYRLLTLLKKPCFVVINKEEIPYLPLEEFCKENHLPVLLRIPYQAELAKLTAEGSLAIETDDSCALMFCQLLQRIRQEVDA